MSDIASHRPRIHMEERRRGSGWFGWVIFLLFVLAPSFLPPLARWLSFQTGIPIGTTELFIAIIVLIIVFSIGSSIVGALRRTAESRDSLPIPRSDDTFRMPPSSPEEVFRVPPPPPEPPRMPTSATQLPGAPRFEPIIDPRILLFGILGLIVIGFVCGVLFLVLNP